MDKSETQSIGSTMYIPINKELTGGAERIVRGSDGSSYYTSDHYKTFKKIE